MKRFNIYQKLAWVALPMAIMLNPVTVNIYLDFIKEVFMWVSLVAMVYISVFLLYSVLKPEQLHIPSKKAKTNKQKYLEA